MATFEPDPTIGGASAANATVRGVHVDHIEHLFELINDRLAAVFEANRYFEDHTGIANKAGSNNLTEALSHIGTLAERGHEMTYEQQRDQVALFGDHLRRSMMESFEQVVKARLGKIKDEGLWDRYHRAVVPLLRRGKLSSAPTEETVYTLGRRVNRLMSEGRGLKRAEGWDAWDAGARKLAEACDESTTLIDLIRQSIGAAEQYRRDRRNTFVAWAALAVTAVSVAATIIAA